MARKRSFRFPKGAFLALAFFAVSPLPPRPLQAGTKYDFVVYGGTAGGVLAAVAGAREGLSVALLEPGAHLGGMLSGGLSATDYGRKEVIGGYALEFFWRLGNYYRMRGYGQDAAWYFEPHVAERVLAEMASEAGVTVLYRHRLREKTGVRTSGRFSRRMDRRSRARFLPTAVTRAT
jgi:flavin-dependent dehydrogenase